MEGEKGYLPLGTAFTTAMCRAKCEPTALLWGNAECV